VLPLTAGRADELFEHDGQITKRAVRAVTLAALAPRRGELLWDIGAGSGSIAIEWMLADPAMRAVAIEADAERAARIGRNASAFGVPGLTVVEGTAPAALAGLPTPDAIFIGGGGTDAGVLDAAIGALPSGGRLVANAVTLEMEALLLAKHAALGGELTRIAISRETAIGSMSGWRPAMPVTQWGWIKPGVKP
jgi:precorrin-6Y C5,15-methyltransferase (decarboxylating)